MRTPDNRVASVLEQYRSQLAEQYSESELKAITRAVFNDRLGWDRSQMEIRKFESLSESELLKVYLPLKRLRAGEPMQYVLGEVDFHGLRLRVGPGVLIPRPETEEMVDRIVRSGIAPSRILDIGTGSGCIAIALKRAFPNAMVQATDVSSVALEIARHNGQLNHLEVEWTLHDIMREEIVGPRDLIVSNPPYVPRAEEASLTTQVRDHEPHLALFVDDADPLLFYRAIGEKAKRVLDPGGHLWFEGHWTHSRDAGGVLSEMGFASVEVMNDLGGNPRFIHARR